MHYTITKLRGVRMAVFLVERNQLSGVQARLLLSRMQARFALPAMLVARDNGNWKGAQARADFDATEYLHALLAIEDLDWAELEPIAEPELPF
jgi:hypothetical protein